MIIIDNDQKTNRAQFACDRSDMTVNRYDADTFVNTISEILSIVSQREDLTHLRYLLDGKCRTLL